MKMDEALHYFFKNNKQIRWHSFLDDWFDEYEKKNECYDYYDYYYAENELYVIRDRVRDTYYFVEARSPYKAYMKFSAMCAEAFGGVYRDRDYTYEDFNRDFCCNCQSREDCDLIPIAEDRSMLADWRENCRDFEPVESIEY